MHLSRKSSGPGGRFRKVLDRADVFQKFRTICYGRDNYFIFLFEPCCMHLNKSSTILMISCFCAILAGKTDDRRRKKLQLTFEKLSRREAEPSRGRMSRGSRREARSMA